jgi:hypothetical protein
LLAALVKQGCSGAGRPIEKEDAMSNATRDERLSAMLAEADIRSVLHGYCQGVDRRDWDQVEQCYHADAVDSHGGYEGDVPGFVAFLKARHQHVISSMHVLTNISIELSADSRAAVAETYCLSHQHVAPGFDDPFSRASGGVSMSTIACRFIDRFEDRPGAGWRIAARAVVFEWMRHESEASYGVLADDWILSKRDSSDLLFDYRSRL